MFSSLRPGATIYVLEQKDKLTLKQGQVMQVVPSYGGAVDVKMCVGDQNYELKQLPYSNTIAKNGELIVSETLSDILKQVSNIKQESETIVNNVSHYESIIKDCNNILADNDPQFAKDKQRDEELVTLKEQVASIQESLTSIEKLLKQNK